MFTPSSAVTLRAQLCHLAELSVDECNSHLLGWAGWLDKCGVLPASPDQATLLPEVDLNDMYLCVAR